MSPLETLTTEQLVRMRDQQLDPLEKPLRNEILHAIHDNLPERQYRNCCYMTLDEELKRRLAEESGPILVWDRRKEPRSDGSNLPLVRNGTTTRH